jgi:hypothetical protein
MQPATELKTQGEAELDTARYLLRQYQAIVRHINELNTTKPQGNQRLIAIAAAFERVIFDLKEEIWLEETSTAILSLLDEAGCEDKVAGVDDALACLVDAMGL